MKSQANLFNSGTSLDPPDWESLRVQSHKMLDDMLDYVAQIRERPVWQRAPEVTESIFQRPIPVEPTSLAVAHETFLQHVLPYAVGNAHPGFMGWVHGGGSTIGMLAEMLAAGLNANLGGRDHIPIAVEQQVVRWMQQLFQFPDSASGLFVTGSSIANFIGILVARTAKIGTDVRGLGLGELSQMLTVYASVNAHGCIAQALELAGIGSNQLRRIAVNDCHQMNLEHLQAAIDADRAAGAVPFCVVGTSGTVDVGAIDDLPGIAAIARRESISFHVDGACGALGMLSPRIATKLQGIEQADSIALDFHKWGQVPYDAGFILIRDSQVHYKTFASPAAYLRRETRGMAAGSPWPCDFGPDLSRSFKALKVWFTLQVYGAEHLGRMMDRTCELASYLASRIAESRELELLAPVTLNIVCFRYRSHEADRVNAEIVIAIQESGIAAPSSTIIDGQFAIRAAIFNHRTTVLEIDKLIDATLRFGRLIAQSVSNSDDLQTGSESAPL
jgi:glutamate/tyrosine decarboxylase-like PLP-dependent enzyme